MAKTIDELNRVYSDADTADKEIFAEQRSNVMLVSGDHYSRRGSRYFNTLRDSRDMNLNDTQKLRLTKNHIHRASRHYKASILSYASSVKILPKNESEMQDQKAAELNESVKIDIRDRYRIKEKIRQYASDFSDIGEVCVVVKWDPMKGDFKGYAPKLDEETGAPILDETGAAVTDETSPQFGGGFVFERAYGMNVLRHVGATTMRDSECYIIRKMVDKKLLQRRYKDDTDKLRYIDSASGEDYIVFDPSRGSYDKTKDNKSR